MRIPTRKRYQQRMIRSIYKRKIYYQFNNNNTF